jgi:structural maintenance of chromosome 1
VKQRRQTLFKDALRAIEQRVEHVYQEITQSTQGAAYLTADNQEEPYLDGLEFRAIPPTKRYHGPAMLSGGEQTLATLALLFAVYSYKPSPFFVLDEIDAHLDPPNVEHVVKFIRNRSRLSHDAGGKSEQQNQRSTNETSQFVVITLNERVAQRSDSMVGVFKNMDEGGSSSTLTLDMTQFDAPQ